MKHRRRIREHGRIMSVETKVRGDALDADAAAGATTLIVGDAGDFDEDGGWLVINDQVVEFTDVDDDEGIITLATGLEAAAEEGDAVHVWSTLYDEVVDYQEALVELDGEYDNPEPVVAEVAEGVGDLPEGDRGVAGESCTLLRVSDDEWEVVGVGGRARKSKGIRFEADDFHTITEADFAAGAATVQLSHRPISESVKLWWRTVAQEPTEYIVDYDARTVTLPLKGFEQVGDRVWVHYAYRKGLPRPATETAYIYDNFQRSVLGSATRMPGNTSVPWETARGTWQVDDSGVLFASAITLSSSVCVIDAGVTDAEVTVVLIGGTGGAGRAFVFRVSADLRSGLGVEMDGRVSYDPDFAVDGNDVTIANLGVSFAPGDEIRVRITGDTFTFFKNRNQVGIVTDSRNSTATRFGFTANADGSATNGFDRFYLKELG